MKREKFTLLELLVVVAIIGLLASMLLPALAKVKAKAKGIECINNQKQVGVSILSYMNDNDGFFHSPNGTTTGTYYNPLWSNWLNQKGYMDVTDVFLCPTRKSEGWNQGWRSYGARYSNAGEGDIDFKGVQDASNYWLLGDSFRDATGEQCHRMLTNYNGGYGQPHKRHNGRSNILLLDGHAESMGNSDLSDVGFNSSFTQGGAVEGL